MQTEFLGAPQDRARVKETGIGAPSGTQWQSIPPSLRVCKPRLSQGLGRVMVKKPAVDLGKISSEVSQPH